MVVNMIARRVIPRVALPLQGCVYCWYAATDAPFPAAWSSTICDDHLSLFFPLCHVENISTGIDARLPIGRAMTVSELLASLSSLPTLCEVYS